MSFSFSVGRDTILENTKVLMKNIKLLAFPALSFIFCFVLLTVFIAPIYLGLGLSINNLTAVSYLIFALFTFFLVASFTMAFFNASLVHALNRHMNGSSFEIGEAIYTAGSGVTEILKYSLVSGTIGATIENKDLSSGWLGKIVTAMGGLKWRLFTYTTLPIIILEGATFLEALREGEENIKRKWSGRVKMDLSVHYIFGSAYCLLMGMCLLGAFLIVDRPVLGVTILISSITLILLTTCIDSAIKSVTSVVLYRHLHSQHIKKKEIKRNISNLFMEPK